MPIHIPSTIAHASLHLPPNPRQAQPEPQNGPKQSQNNGLQHLDALRLSDCSHREWEYCSTGATERSSESDRADVQVPGKQLGGDDYNCGEQRSHQKPLQGDGDGGDVELRDEPEDELESHGEGEVDLGSERQCLRIDAPQREGSIASPNSRHGTYHDGQPFTNPRRDEAQDDPPDSNPHPVPRRHHAAREVPSASYFQHEFDNPAAKCDFDAYVAQEEYGADPCDACVGHADKCFCHAAVLTVGGALVIFAEYGTSLGPESCHRSTQFDNSESDLSSFNTSCGRARHDMKAYHDIVEHVPRKPLAFGNHGRSDERREHGAETIKAMQEAQHLVCIGHISNPYVDNISMCLTKSNLNEEVGKITCIPRCIGQTIAKACYHEDNDQYRVRRMHRNDNIGYNMTSRRKECHTPLAKLEVDSVVKQSRCSVPYAKSVYQYFRQVKKKNTHRQEAIEISAR